ncbi:MAG: ScpA family protein, partial [Pseudomonadota bacterium]
MPEDLLELPVEAFDTPPRDQEALAAEVLSVNVQGYEGPLDLLLTLARTQKVDLREVSILQLAEQYLEFVSAAQKLRIELAADYLVMAAWLAYLKSRLLLPPPHPEDEPSGADMAARLAFQLERLEAMRKASAALMARDQLGRDFFARGMTETVTVKRETTWTATLSDLLKAYARVKTREQYQPLQVDRRA